MNLHNQSLSMQVGYDSYIYQALCLHDSNKYALTIYLVKDLYTTTDNFCNQILMTC